MMRRQWVRLGNNSDLLYHMYVVLIYLPPHSLNKILRALHIHYPLYNTGRSIPPPNL